MNNHQLLNHLGSDPYHPLRQVQMSNIFARWLTMTAQPPKVEGMTFTEYKNRLLDLLYTDWRDFEAEQIAQYGPAAPVP